MNSNEEKRFVGQGRALKIIAYFGLAVWGLLVLFPYYWMVLTSVKSFGAYASEYVPKFFTLEPTLQNYIDAGQPEKVFTNVAYTLEENERLAEIQKELTDFIKDRRAQFCTGVLDPRDDAQWQAYLDNLKALRYDEWVEIAQTAYDRMQK